MALIDILRGIPLFKNLEKNDLELIASQLHKERYPKGSVIFREGDVGDTMYLVESGRVAVVGEEARDTIAIMGPGSFVGEISLLLAKPRTANLQVMIDAELWVLNKEEFEHLISTGPSCIDYSRATHKGINQAVAAFLKCRSKQHVFDRICKRKLQAQFLEQTA